MNNSINVVRRSTVDTPHRKQINIRGEENEEAGYLQSMAKRQKLHDNAWTQQQQQYPFVDHGDHEFDMSL